MSIKPRSVVESLHGFKPALPDRTLPELRRILGKSNVAKLSFNESPYGPSPLAVAAIQSAAESVHCYHDPEGKILKDKLAAFYGVESNMVFLASGADEAISLLTQGFLNPGEEVIVQQPTFGQYAAAATLAAGTPMPVAVLPDLTTDFDGMLAAITSVTKMIFVCNPNNPTGIVEGEAGLRSFLSRIPGHILVVLDEAYAEYVSRPDFVSGISLLAEFSNILVIRTFSKLYGLAGLRLGYGIASEKIVSVIERIRNPFNINSLALAAAEAALDDHEFRQQVARQNQEQRVRLTQELTNLGFTVYPSETNFLFVDTHTDSDKLCEALVSEGIIIRSGLGWDRPSFSRISIGSQEQNDRLLACLQCVL